MSTNFLNLDLPTVSVTLGPEWATKVNAAFDTIDLHDHTSGKGVQIPSSGLNINANVDANDNSIINLTSTKFSSQGSVLTGTENSNSINVSSGNLYFTNNSGTAVQITEGASVITSAGALQTVELQSVASDLTITPSDSLVYLTVDTSAARTITLPLANAVAAGRIYIIKDKSGLSNTNNITISTQGSDIVDEASTQTLNSNYGSWWVVGDGTDTWYIS